MKNIFIILLFGCLGSGKVHAQKITVQEYIDTYKDIAMAEMIRSGVPAAITLAQGVLETENGNSELVKKSNNHFGIKCKAEWKGETVYHDDDEKGECFRKYDSAVHSYRDHSDFLRTRAHYAFLFSLSPTNYKAWAYGLKKAGYATNPRYPQILIKTIEDYHLNDLSEKALQDIQDYSVFRILPLKKNESPVSDPTENEVLSPKEKSDTLAAKYNGLKATHVKAGTSLLSVAVANNLTLSALLDYNDLVEDEITSTPCWLYLERKRIKGLQPFCKVKENETLLDIAQSNGIQLGFLLTYNRLSVNDKIKAGDILSLQPDSKTSLKKKNHIADEVKDNRYHEVKRKESLYSISRLYKISVSELRSINKLKSDKIAVGQKLLISK